MADGTTWVVDEKVFGNQFKNFLWDSMTLFFAECCRGDIVIKTEFPEITTKKPAPATEKVVLITGGYSDQDTKSTLYSAEIFRPKESLYKSCILYDLSEPYRGHTQDGGMVCGGIYTEHYCQKWDPKHGKFYFAHKFSPARYHLVSWTPVSKKETFLIGGGSSKTRARSTSSLVKSGIEMGIPDVFNLTHPIYGACSIPWPEQNKVIITGGNTDSPQNRRTSVYNEKGHVENLGHLKHQRRDHGCTSYVSDNKRVGILFVFSKDIITF